MSINPASQHAHRRVKLCTAALTVLTAVLPFTYAFANPGKKTDGLKQCELRLATRQNVVAIKDSETLKLADGRFVRLIGLLAPRPPLKLEKQDAWPPEDEARAALQTLVHEKDVSLAFDARKRDRYGNMLAHVFVSNDGVRFWVQGELLAHGHARAAVLPGNTACIRELLAHERLARETKRGLWQHRHYRILYPNPANWLLANRRHSFAIVSGRVNDVAIVKGRIYLNFGNNWRQDFTAALRKRALAGTETTESDLKRLVGRTVNVRGWIERRNGPYIQLAHPHLIEAERREPPADKNSKDQDLQFRSLVRASDPDTPFWLRKQNLPKPKIVYQSEGQKDKTPGD